MPACRRVIGRVKISYHGPVAKLLLALSLTVAGVHAYRNRDWARYFRLYRESTLTYGWVTGKRPPVVDYAFEADKLRTGTDTGGYGNPPTDELDEGEQVLIYFDPRDPGLSCLGSPGDRMRDQNSALLTVLLPAFLIAGLAFWREMRRHGPQLK